MSADSRNGSKLIALAGSPRSLQVPGLISQLPRGVSDSVFVLDEQSELPVVNNKFVGPMHQVAYPLHLKSSDELRALVDRFNRTMLRYDRFGLANVDAAFNRALTARFDEYEDLMGAISCQSSNRELAGAGTQLASACV